MTSRLYAVVFGLVITAPAVADSLDLNLHDDALRITYATGAFHEGDEIYVLM